MMIAGKNGELVVLPVTEAMREAYLVYTAERTTAGLPTSTFALGSKRGIKLHKRTMSGDIEQACKSAGFTHAQRLHALRYTAAMRLVEMSVPYSTVQELTGHWMAEMAKSYTERKRAAPRKAAVFRRQATGVCVVGQVAVSSAGLACLLAYGLQADEHPAGRRRVRLDGGTGREHQRDFCGIP